MGSITDCNAWEIRGIIHIIHSGGIIVQTASWSTPPLMPFFRAHLSTEDGHGAAGDSRCLCRGCEIIEAHGAADGDGQLGGEPQQIVNSGQGGRYCACVIIYPIVRWNIHILMQTRCSQ